MKKLMSIVLALVMALSLCVTTTWAADATEVGTVEAFKNAVSSGGAIKLTADITLTEKLMLSQDLTIDLNGHKLAQDGNELTGDDEINAGGTFIQVIDDKTLTIIGTTPGSQVYGRINVGMAEDNNGNAVLNGGTYTCEDGNTALHVNGTCLNSNVTIKNATITTKDNGIQLSGKGTFLIENSTITGYTAIYVKSGTLTIKNSTLIGNMNPVDYSYNGNGSNATGDALVVDSCEYPGGAPTITIENSTLKGTKAAVGAYEYVKTSATHTPANVEVKSGSLIGGVQAGITKTVTGATTDVDTTNVAPTSITFPTGTPVATNGDDYYVGSDSIADAANSGKEMTMVQGGAIDGLEPGATIIVPQGVTGTTLNGNAAEHGYYTIADPNAYQHEPVRRQHTTTVEDTTTTTDTKADDTTKADTVTSAKTFDAGVAVYGVMAVLSLTGSAWVVGKKRV